MKLTSLHEKMRYIVTCYKQSVMKANTRKTFILPFNCMNDNLNHPQLICQTLAAGLLVFFFLFAGVLPVMADFEDGFAASQKGDYATALHEFGLLAENGHAKAQLQLGIMYELGLGTQKDFQEASKWYQKAAIQGNAEAHKKLVEMKNKGRRDFTPPPIPKNFTGNMTEPQAQYDLGTMYYRGIGVNKDLQAAYRWFEVAAHQGHPRAQNDLAVMLLKGVGTGKTSSTKAFSWFLKAAEQGFGEAQFNLGLMLSSGEGHGIPQHFTLAYMWFEIAALNNMLEARNRQVLLTRKMKQKDISEAKEQARQWLSKHGISK